MKRIACFLILASSLLAPACYSADNQPLGSCLTQSDAVDYASKCILAGGTSSACVNGSPQCCKKYADGNMVCVSNPKGVIFEKLKSGVVPQTPSRPIERK